MHFQRWLKGKPAASDDLQQINDFAVEALSHRRLARADGHYRWEWQWNNKNLLGQHSMADRAVGSGPAHLTRACRSAHVRSA